jgi:adenylosuccinate lyase
LCSADISDNATSLQVCQVADLLQLRLTQLRKVLVEMANEYKYTLMMGRTHGTHAEPITFGLKMALWVKEVDRSLARLNHARHVMAVGTFSSIDPHVETFVCRRLGLHPAFVTTQILQRDRLAEFIGTLAIIGSSLEKFAVEIRNLQRTDIREVEEDMAEGQLGSTSLPHKQRPSNCETISGLARVLRGNALVAMENIPIWHEQDASHSSAERIIVPDSCILLDYMLYQFTQVMEQLIVYPDNMRRNIEDSLGLVFSQRVLLALMDRGVMRDQAYDMVMRCSRVAWEQRIDFQYLILEDKGIGEYLSREEIMDLFNYDHFRRNIDFIFERAGI